MQLPDRLSRVAEAAAVGLLCAAAVLAPLALGATGVWTRLMLETATVAVVCLWAVSGRRSMWAMIPALLASAMVVLQLVPIGDRVLVMTAPISAGAWKLAHQGLPGAWGRISVDPAATAAAGRRLFLALATIAVIADLGRRSSYRRWLIGAISVSAVTIIGAGLLFPVGKTDRVVLGFIDLKGPIEWWRTPLANPEQSAGWAYVENVCVEGQCYKSDLALVGDAYGSYVCCNKFAGAMCLTLPVGLAAFLFCSRNRLPGFLRYGLALAVFAGAVWIAVVAIYSRAGTVALVGSGLTLVALIAPVRSLRLIASVMAVCCVATLILFMMMFVGPLRDAVGLLPAALQAHIGPLLADGRLLAVSVAARMFRASPVMGTGLGSYSDLCPRMMPGEATWYYAHNDYAQFIAETGIFGGALLLAGVFLLARCFMRFVRTATLPERIMDAGPWAAVAGIAAHSLFDWNLHVPANAFLACLACGLALAGGPVVVVPIRGASSPELGRRHRAWIDSTAQAVLASACIAAAVFLARDASAAAVKKTIRTALVADRIAWKNPTQQSAGPQLLAARDAGERMSHWDRRDASLHALLAQVNVHLAALAARKDATVNASAEEFVRAAARHSKIAMLASPTVRGLPEAVPTPPAQVRP